MITIVKEKAGVMSEEAIWLLYDSKGYLYTGDSLFKLIKLAIKEWRYDRHLVG